MSPCGEEPWSHPKFFRSFGSMEASSSLIVERAGQGGTAVLWVLVLSTDVCVSATGPCYCCWWTRSWRHTCGVNEGKLIAWTRTYMNWLQFTAIAFPLTPTLPCLLISVKAKASISPRTESLDGSLESTLLPLTAVLSRMSVELPFLTATSGSLSRWLTFAWPPLSPLWLLFRGLSTLLSCWFC